MKKKHLQWISYTLLAAGLSLSSLSAGEDLVDFTNATPDEIPAVVDADGNPLFTQELTVEKVLDRLQKVLDSAKALSAQDKGEAKNLELTITRTNISLRRLQQALRNGETVNPGIYEGELERSEAKVQEAIERMQERAPLQDQDIPTVADQGDTHLSTEEIETQVEAPAQELGFDAETAFDILNEALQALRALVREVRDMLRDPMLREMHKDLSSSSYIERTFLYDEMKWIEGDINNRLDEETTERLGTAIEGHITYVESFREELVESLTQHPTQQEIANVANPLMQELHIQSDILTSVHPSS